MIRVALKQQGHLLDDLSGYLESFQQTVDATTVEVVTEVEPEVLAELRYTPPLRNPNETLEWTSDAQRVAFMASGGFGGGIPHQRTGALPDGWTVVVQGGKVIIANNVPGAVYLYGSLSRSNPGKWQQGYLRAIGWLPAYQTVYAWTDIVAGEVLRRIDAQFKGMGTTTAKTRAYTRR